MKSELEPAIGTATTAAKTVVATTGVEVLAKKIQLKILPANLRALMNKDTRVIINDQILKLYLVDRRAEFSAKYQEKLRLLNL